MDLTSSQTVHGFLLNASILMAERGIVGCGYTVGFPMGVIDAWVYGLPVITTPVGGIPDIAIDGKNMLLFTPGDIDALA